MKTAIASSLILLSTLAMADDAALIAETRNKTLEIPPKLFAMVQEEIGKGSFDGATAACRSQQVLSY